MRGVKKEHEKKRIERDDFVRKLFLADCAVRAKAKFKTKDGYYMEPLSGPKTQEIYKKKFKVSLNSQRLFDIRRDVWHACGLDGKGRPKAKAQAQSDDKLQLEGVAPLVAQPGPALTAAARDPNDPIYNVAIIPIEDMAQGVFLKQSIEKLGERGLVDKELRVDGIHTRYATVSRFPTEPLPAA